MGALFDTTGMFRQRLVESKKSDGRGRHPANAGWKHEGAGPCRTPPLARRTAEGYRLLLFATATLEVPHLVEPAFLLGCLPDHPLPLLGTGASAEQGKNEQDGEQVRLLERNLLTILLSREVC